MAGDESPEGDARVSGLAERLIRAAVEICDHFPTDPICEDCAILAVRAALVEAAQVARDCPARPGEQAVLRATIAAVIEAL